MLTGHQDLYFGETGQTLFLDVPEGRPSSVTQVLVLAWDFSDAADSEWTVSTTSIDAVNTTFDANSGASSTNPRLVNLAATTSIVAGRQYLATDVQGRREWVVVSGITSAQSVTALLGLGLDYVSADTFQGTRISTTVDATWIADTANINTGLTAFDRWRIRWEYVVSGTTYVRTTTFSVVRRAGQHTVTPPDLALRYPSLFDSAPTSFRHERLQLLIDRAYEEFSTDLLSISLPDEQILSPKVVNEMVVLKTAVIIGQDRAMAQGETRAMEIAERIYGARFQTLFGSPSLVKVPVSTDSSGAGDRRAAINLSVR